MNSPSLLYAGYNQLATLYPWNHLDIMNKAPRAMSTANNHRYEKLIQKVALSAIVLLAAKQLTSRQLVACLLIGTTLTQLHPQPLQLLGKPLVNVTKPEDLLLMLTTLIAMRILYKSPLFSAITLILNLHNAYANSRDIINTAFSKRLISSEREAQTNCDGARIELTLFKSAFNICNIRSLLSYYVTINSLMSASKFYYEGSQPVMKRIVREALEMPQFNSVLTEKDKTKSPTEQLVKLLAHAKDQMTTREYLYHLRYLNPMYRAFFAKFATQIQKNKDRATVALANALYYTDRRDSIWRRVSRGTVEEIRAWFNDPDNSKYIQGVDVLCFSNGDLKVLPDELLLFTGISYLDLSNNDIENVVGLSELTQLKYLYLSDTPLTSVKGLFKLTSLKTVCLKNTQLSIFQKLSIHLNLR